MFLMNLKTLSRWLVMTEFEMLLNVLSLLIFSVLLCIRIDFYDSVNSDILDYSSLKWFHVFLPLFIVDILQANFITIVFMRQIKENQSKEGILRLFFSILFLMSRFLFKIAIYFLVSQTAHDTSHRLMHDQEDSQYISSNYAYKPPFKFQLAATPIFFHLSILMFRSCCLKKYQSYS